MSSICCLATQTGTNPLHQRRAVASPCHPWGRCHRRRPLPGAPCLLVISPWRRPLWVKCHLVHRDALSIYKCPNEEYITPPSVQGTPRLQASEARDLPLSAVQASSASWAQARRLAARGSAAPRLIRGGRAVTRTTSPTTHSHHQPPASLVGFIFLLFLRNVYLSFPSFHYCEMDDRGAWYLFWWKRSGRSTYITHTLAADDLQCKEYLKPWY